MRRLVVRETNPQGLSHHAALLSQSFYFYAIMNKHLHRISQLNSMLESEPEQAFVLFALAKEYDAVDEVDLAIEYFETSTLGV